MRDYRMTWQNPRILFVLLLVFVSGATAGALAARFGLRPPKTPASYWKEGGKEISLDRFRRELNLNPEQARQMEVVLNDFVTYYQTLQEQMNGVRADGKARILQILDEEQKQKFEKMVTGLQRQLK